MTHHTGSDEGRLSEAEREMLDEPIYDADLDMHQRSDRVEQVVERILAAPDALRERHDVDSLARVLMAAWEAAEGKPVTPSYVATFADMARAALADPTDGATR